MDIRMRHNDRGIVLAGVLILLISITLIAVTVARRNTMDEMMAANQRDALNALSISDSGIEAGFSLVKQNYVNGQVLEDDLTQLPNNILLQDSVSGGNYLVTVIDGVANDGIVTLNSLSDYNGSVREIEIVLEMRHPGRAAYAILTQDDNRLDGSSDILGPYADVHSNSNIELVGSVNISGTATASGIVDLTGSPSVGGGTVSGADNVEIAHVYPPEYQQYATVIFTADCKVESPGGVQWADLSGGGQWNAWSCFSGVSWTLNGGSPPPGGFYDGFYYVHGNVNIGGIPAGNTMLMTIVAEGNIDVSGNAIFKPWASQLPNDTGDAEANDILFLAGNDLKIIGSPSSEFHGIMAAHMEVSVSGTSVLTGSILAENGLHSMGQEVTTGQQVVNLVSSNEFGGNLDFTGSGSGLGAVKKLAATAWRELVH